MARTNLRKRAREASSSSNERSVNKRKRDGNKKRETKRVQRAAQVTTSKKLSRMALTGTKSRSAGPDDFSVDPVHAKLDVIEAHMAKNDYRQAYQGFRLLANDNALRDAADKAACLRMMDIWRTLGDEKRQTLESLKMINEAKREAMELRSELRAALQENAELKARLDQILRLR